MAARSAETGPWPGLGSRQPRPIPWLRWLAREPLVPLQAKDATPTAVRCLLPSTAELPGVAHHALVRLNPQPKNSVQTKC